MTEDEARLNRLHTDHCLNFIRHAILWYTVVALFTPEWSEGQAQPRTDFSHGHTCVDWEAVFQGGEKCSSRDGDEFEASLVWRGVS